jgi:isoaspartyl peptidase/L-asparaginase-like protein (Ntn-hydrolase superfamily)
MEHTDHALVVGAGAEQLAERAGLHRVDQDYLVTAEGRREWELYKKYSHAVSSLFR